MDFHSQLMCRTSALDLQLYPTLLTVTFLIRFIRVIWAVPQLITEMFHRNTPVIRLTAEPRDQMFVFI